MSDRAKGSPKGKGKKSLGKSGSKSNGKAKSNVNQFEDHNDSVGIGLQEVKLEFQDRHNIIVKHLEPLRSTQVYTMLRKSKENAESQSKHFEEKFESSHTLITKSMKSLESQNDSLAIDSRNKDDDISSKKGELEALKQSSEKESESMMKEIQSRDDAFSKETQEKKTQLHQLLEEISTLKEKLGAAAKDREKLFERLDQTEDMVSKAKDLKFNPDDLALAEKEKSMLEATLSSLQTEKTETDERAEKISLENDKLEIELSKQTQNKQVSQTMKKEREQVYSKVRGLAQQQNELFNQNIEKLRQLRDVEFEISQKSKILPILKDKIYQKTKDMQAQAEGTQNELEEVEQGSNDLHKVANTLNNKVENPAFKDAISKIWSKISSLQDTNSKVKRSCDQLRGDIITQRTRLNDLDFNDLNPSEIDSAVKENNQVKSTYSQVKSDTSKNQSELEKLKSELDALKEDIQADYERNIKIVQKKDEAFVSETSDNLTTAKDIIATLLEKMDEDNPQLADLKNKLLEIKNKLNNTNVNNESNKTTMKGLSSREPGDGDYLDFLITLSVDQQGNDRDIQTTKESSQSLLKALQDVQEEFEELDKNSRSEILHQLNNEIRIKARILNDLEDKLMKLEKIEIQYVDLHDDALQTVNSDNPNYAEIKEMPQNPGNHSKLRKQKDALDTEVHEILTALDKAEQSAVTMTQLICLQTKISEMSSSINTLSSTLDTNIQITEDLYQSLLSLLTQILSHFRTKTGELYKTTISTLTSTSSFLTPTCKTENSIQRPKSLLEILNNTYLSETDSEYTQFCTYKTLVSGNMDKCEKASGDLGKIKTQVSGVVSTYAEKSQEKDMIKALRYLQGAYGTLEKEKEGLEGVDRQVQEILEELGPEQEQEILDFLNQIQRQRHGDAEERLRVFLKDLNELFKQWNGVNDENEGFLKTLLKVKPDNKNKEKIKLVESLVKESDVSKKDLKNIKKAINEMKEQLEEYNVSQLSLKTIHELYEKLTIFEESNENIRNDLISIDQDIEERKRKWQEYVTKTEVMNQLITEFWTLHPLSLEKYQKLIKTHNFCNNSLNGFYLVNEKIENAEFYETNETPCLNRDQIKQQLSEFADKIEEYAPKVDKFEHLDQQRFAEMNKTEIETLISDLKSLIQNLEEDNKSVDEISTYLREERKDFKNGDVYVNQRKIARNLETAEDRIQGIIQEYEGFKENIEQSEIPDKRIQHQMKELEDKIINANEGLNDIKNEFDTVCAEIDREKNMDTAKLATLANVIEKLGNLAKRLHGLNEEFDALQQALKDYQNELVDLYYSQKLQDMINVVKLLLDRLARLSDLIDKLIELAHEFDGYTSDNEEEEFVSELDRELAEVKQHHSETEDELRALEKQINELQAALLSDPAQIDEQKADQVDSAIGELSKMIENIEKLVDSKIQRFADMDPYKKFRRREKELNKLNIILQEREDKLNELKAECIDDINNPDASDELKEIGRDVLDEMDSLEENLDNQKQRMALLANEIASYLEKSAKTEMTIEEIFELLYANVDIKKKLKVLLAGIDEFSKLMSENRKRYLIKKAECPVKKTYKAAKGDQVDEMLGNWINTHGCEIEIKRLGGGFYMFGEKKIYAKIINGKLIIRVGGGYMNIDEFMQHYGMMELARQQRIYEMEYESITYDDLANEEEVRLPADRHQVMGLHEVKKGLRSSFGGSFVKNKGGSPRGSPRTTRNAKPGSPGGSFVERPGSPRTGKAKQMSPRNRMHKAASKREMPSAAKIEESLRKMEEDAKHGKLKEGYKNMSFKK